MASQEEEETEQLNELKKKSLQNAITSLTREWSDVRTERYLQQQDRFTQLESPEKRLLSIQQSLAQSNEDLYSIRQTLEGRSKEIEQLHDQRTNQFNSSRVEVSKLLDERMNELNLKEKQLDLREEKLDAYHKSIEGLFKKLDMDIKQFESIQKSVGEKLEEVNLKERKLESRERLLKLAQNFYVECNKEFHFEEPKSKDKQPQGLISDNLDEKEAQNKVPKILSNSQFTSLYHHRQPPEPDMCDHGAFLVPYWGFPGAEGVTAGSNFAQPSCPWGKQDLNEEASKFSYAAKRMELGGSRNTSRKRGESGVSRNTRSKKSLPKRPKESKLSNIPPAAYEDEGDIESLFEEMSFEELLSLALVNTTELQ
ncbi:hypothetical protein LguiB_024193 [Lonicera macranthoides]